MKKTNLMMTPLFMAVIILLSVGAVGELFSSLLRKVKSLLSVKQSATETSLESATQLK